MARDAVPLREPRFARWLFTSTAAAWIWLAARLYFGWEWLSAGWDKLTDPRWMSGGYALQEFAQRASTEMTQGERPAVAYGWYGDVLRWVASDGYPWVAKVVAIAETTVGILLIVGLLTGIAAFAGGALTMSFGLAGTAGVNPVFFFFEVLCVLAWRNAGYIGLDRWALPALGTPWAPGRVIKGARASNRRIA